MRIWKDLGDGKSMIKGYLKLKCIKIKKDMPKGVSPR